MRKRVNIIISVIFIGWIIYYLSPLLNINKIIGSLPGDTYYYAYETKWFCENYFKGNLRNTELYAPGGVDMSLGYHMPALLSVGCLLYPLGPIAMFNFIEALQVVIILFSSLVVARKFIKNNYIRVSFVFLYSFSSFYLARLYGHTDILSTIWGPSLVFYNFFDLDLLNRKKVVFAFLVVVFVFTSCWQNIPNLFVLISFLLILNFYKTKNKQKLVVSNLLVSIVISSVAFTFLSFPMFYSFISKSQIKNYDANYSYNADLLSYIIPINGNIFQNYSDRLIDKIAFSRNGTYFEQYNSIDIFVLIVFVLALYSKKKLLIPKKIVVFLILVQLILSFGPYLTIAGFKIFDLPYYTVLMTHPPFSITRTPARLGIVVTFLVTIYSHTYLDAVFKKNKNYFQRLILFFICFYGIITSTILAKNTKILHHDYAKSMPLNGLKQINSDKRDVFVLNLPLSTLGDDASQNFLTLFHEKKIVSGLVSYAAQSNAIFSSIRTNPVLSKLGCANDRFPYNPFDKNGINSIMDNSYLFSSLLKESNIGYVIVNKNLLKENYCENIRKFVASLSLFDSMKLVDETAGYLVYKIVNANADQIDTTYYYSTNWTQPWDEDLKRWSIGLDDSLIHVYANKEKKVTIRAKLFHFTDKVSKEVGIVLNNWKSKFTTNPNEDIIFSATLSAGWNSIKFVSSSCEKPADYLVNEDQSCYSFGLSNFQIKDLSN